MNRLIFWVFPLMLFACKSNKSLVDQADQPYEIIIEETYLDTLTVSAPREVVEFENDLPVYRNSYNRTNDLLHTRLNLSFDWEKQYVLGEAELYFEAIRENNTLELHAQNFIIEEVKLNESKAIFTYDNQNIIISLDHNYKRGEAFDVYIKYVARPNEGEIGGSNAITSNKGLFFINPNNKLKDKPRQIWTQGETEHNSRWFPTIDKPNERCTQEMYLTVENDLETLSNGLLISSKDNGNGTRTDYWKQNLAHAPYLFMVAVGDFSITKDQWKDLPLMYYVDPEFEDYAEKIYNHTPEMLTFFSEILDYPYPWEKYAQVAVADYVSGAMENTTAVIFGDFVVKTERELIDNHNDQIVAHEMFHHWFGDLVTCESWSNLTMNEGFANYSEYLWYEHKYGKDEAELHRMNELSAYIQSGLSMGFHDLIDHEYVDKEDMFDAHSYNKGGLVLHMLRDYLGDEVFFAGLNEFLETHQYTAVEAHDLRLTMEEVSGEDLNWFFDQWYFSSGQPDLNITYSLTSTNEVVVDVRQTQEDENFPSIFQLPVTTKVYLIDGQIKSFPVFLNKRSQSFVFGPFDQEVAAVVFDGDHIVLGQFEEESWKDFSAALLMHSKEFQDKYQAAKNLSETGFSPNQLSKALSEDSHIIRMIALSQINDIETLEELVQKDKHSLIRTEALYLLYEQSPERAFELSKKLIKEEQAYPPIVGAISIIYSFDPDLGVQTALEMSDGYAKPFYPILFDLLAESKNPKHLEHFENELNKIDIMNIFNYFQSYRDLAQYGSVEQNLKAANLFEEIALDPTNMSFKRYIAAYSIKQLKLNLQDQTEKIAGKTSKMMVFDKLIDGIIKKENDPSMKARFQSLK